MTFLIFRPKASEAIFRVKNALIPQLTDSDGRALHKDSESGLNSKITKITNMTFLQNTAVFTLSCLKRFSNFIIFENLQAIRKPVFENFFPNVRQWHWSSCLSSEAVVAVVSLQVSPGVIDIMLEMCSALEFRHQLLGVPNLRIKIIDF